MDDFRLALLVEILLISLDSVIIRGLIRQIFKVKLNSSFRPYYAI